MAEIEVTSEPVRVARDSAEVFTSAIPSARDVFLAAAMVRNRPSARAMRDYLDGSPLALGRPWPTLLQCQQSPQTSRSKPTSSVAL